MTTPARKDVTQSVALETIVAYLRTAMDLDESHCYEVESEEYVPKIPIGGDFWLTVAADEGRFPPEEQGPTNITEEGGFIVTAWSRVQLDRTDHAQRLYHDTKRGLLEIKRQILRALCNADPVTNQGYTFVRQTIYAIRATRPSTWKHEDSGLPMGKLQVVFGMDFDWLLTADAEIE